MVIRGCSVGGDKRMVEHHLVVEYDYLRII